MRNVEGVIHNVVLTSHIFLSIVYFIANTGIMIIMLCFIEVISNGIDRF